MTRASISRLRLRQASRRASPWQMRRQRAPRRQPARPCSWVGWSAGQSDDQLPRLERRGRAGSRERSDRAADPRRLLDRLLHGAPVDARRLCRERLDRPLSRRPGAAAERHRQPECVRDHQGAGLPDLHRQHRLHRQFQRLPVLRRCAPPDVARLRARRAICRSPTRRAADSAGAVGDGLRRGPAVGPYLVQPKRPVRPRRGG